MADCRMIAVYCRTQSLAEIVKQIQNSAIQTTPLIEAQQKILEYNKGALVPNQLSKSETAAILKNLETLEATLLNIQSKNNDARLLNHYLQRNLFCITILNNFIYLITIFLMGRINDICIP